MQGGLQVLGGVSVAFGASGATIGSGGTLALPGGIAIAVDAVVVLQRVQTAAAGGILYSVGSKSSSDHQSKLQEIYKKGDRYYYRDTFHTGESAHLEVFDKRGNHLGEADPITGILRPGTADSSKSINVQ